MDWIRVNGTRLDWIGLEWTGVNETRLGRGSDLRRQKRCHRRRHVHGSRRTRGCRDWWGHSSPSAGWAPTKCQTPSSELSCTARTPTLSVSSHSTYPHTVCQFTQCLSIHTARIPPQCLSYSHSVCQFTQHVPPHTVCQFTQCPLIHTARTNSMSVNSQSVCQLRRCLSIHRIVCQ